MKKLIGLSAILLTTSFAWADQDSGSTAQFLKIGQGARAQGMGGAYTAVADDAHAIYWNPAGLAQVTKYKLALDHLSFIEEINSQFASFVVPFNKFYGSLGVGLTYIDMGSIDRLDSNGVADGGDSDVNAYAASVSWGQAIGDRFAIGVSGKNINQNLAGTSKSSLAADAGALLFLVPNRLGLGASVSNIGPKVKLGTTEENLPLIVRAGSVFYAVPGKLTFAADVEKERDTDATLHGGAEYTYMQRFILRVGYQDNHEAGGGITAGAGFNWKASQENSDFFGKEKKSYESFVDQGVVVRFDYAFVDYGDFDTTHRIGIQISF